MADPRNAVKFDGIGYQAETFKIDDSTITYDSTEDGGSAQVGLAVTLSTDDTVALVADGNDVLGKLIKVESDDKAVVQTKGYCTLPGGDSASLTLGEKIVGDLGAAAAKGYIRVVATGTAAELGHARHRIVNNDVTTAVVVELGV
jgi:hypothetical protein